MHCSRCRGFMVEDHFLDIEGGFREMWTASWRCMNCGHVHDAVIEQHRLAQQETVVVCPSMSRTIRMRKSIWEPSHSSGTRPDPTWPCVEPPV